MATTRVNFRLPSGLVERADPAAEIVGDTRTGIVTAALRAYLDEIESDEAFEEELVEQYLAGEIDDTALRAVLGARDAAAVRASAALLGEAGDVTAALAAAGEAR